MYCKTALLSQHPWSRTLMKKFTPLGTLTSLYIHWVYMASPHGLLLYHNLILVSWLAHYTPIWIFCFVNKGPSSQGYAFSSGHVWMWELDYKESWAQKNLCFWTVVLKETLESPLDCKEIQPVHPNGGQSWVFIGRTDAEAETPILWPPHAKCWLIGKTLVLGGIGGRRRRGKQRMKWLDGITNSRDTPAVGDGQGGLACCGSWGHKESDKTEWLNWTELMNIL